MKCIGCLWIIFIKSQLDLFTNVGGVYKVIFAVLVLCSSRLKGHVHYADQCGRITQVTTAFSNQTES